VQNSIVVFGIGELGSVFSRAFLKNNHPVYPVTRHTNLQELSLAINPELVLIATGEADLSNVLNTLPNIWKNKIGLIQNELLPQDWEAHHLTNPTIISVWFEKKKGMDSKVLIPSPVFGEKSQLIIDALNTLKLPTRKLNTENELLFELVLKNIYILTTNLAGLSLPAGTTVETLQNQHPELMDAVFNEVLMLQNRLTQQNFTAQHLKEALSVAFQGDLSHQCMGRSAPVRLKRALCLAQNLGIETPVLNQLQANF
jgi:hypothetical protein